MNLISLIVALLFLVVAGAWAKDEAWPDIPRVLPPKGIEIPAADRQILEQGVAAFQQRLKSLASKINARNPAEDAEVYAKAVEWALRFDEFYKPQQVNVAKEALKTANARLDAIAQDPPAQPWREKRGPVALGYRSSIDGSVQPFGVVVPEKLDLTKPAALYVWLHGRGDAETDLHFLAGRQAKAGEMNSDSAITLHAFGRHCLGFKSAGEIDVLDAIEEMKQRYKIDSDRIILMGFSMGGAGAWHIGAHYADHFAGVHTGAGFVDVVRYQKVPPEKFPPKYEQTLWGVYDVPDYTRNLFNVPLLSYSGEIDKQKESADIMEEEFKKEGQNLLRIIGPNMLHKYDPESRAKVLKWAAESAAGGRDNNALEVHLQTRTLRYNRMKWLEITALDEHWRDSRIDAAYDRDGKLAITTKNVASFQTSKPKVPRALSIDGQTVENLPIYVKSDGKWKGVPKLAESATPVKRHGLQGPIDDAFLQPFLIVLPSGKSPSAAVERWVKFESQHQITRWEALFRGKPRVKYDREVTAADVAQFNLILWGDPDSNSLIGQYAKFLPVAWTDAQLKISDQQASAADHVAVLVYPNLDQRTAPSTGRNYVVLNSGPTFREGHDRTNSLQNPKLPDWAIIDVTVPPSAESPGKVVAADFFDESWRVRPTRQK